ncbi:MAG: hypothetical protein RMI56_04930 [Sulfolobales archaeon]|nr:hypothetical protein [Sulfolobales archaeon]MDW8083126.1 hypothetical protein [Sulfolobales archaeon]
MNSSTLVLYVNKDGSTDVRLYDEKGLLVKEQNLTSVKHIKIGADRCVADISFAEFEDAVVLRVTGKIDLAYRSSVLEVSCIGY